MSEANIKPLSLSDRIAVVDVLRGLAVGGILIGNLQWFSGYGWLPPSLAALNPATDQLARFLVHAFVEGKFYSIFSFLFGFGLISNVIFASFAKSEADFPPTAIGIIGVVAYAYGVPALALGIAAMIVRLWDSGVLKSGLAILAPVGRMALTNYVLQSVICVILFYGYGFGLFGRFGAAGSTLIGVAIFAGQIAASGIWLRLFRYGPMEWIWRQFTYRKRLSLSKKRS